MGKPGQDFYYIETDDAAGFWEETTTSSGGIHGT
jgi:hypothetical protein